MIPVFLRLVSAVSAILDLNESAIAFGKNKSKKFDNCDLSNSVYNAAWKIKI